MRLKDSQHKWSSSAPLCLHYSQKRWKTLAFFVFTGLAIFLVCNSSNIHAENLTVFVFEQKGLEKVPLEGAGIFLNDIFKNSTDVNGRVELKDMSKGSHILEVKKTSLTIYKTKLIIEFDKQMEVVLGQHLKIIVSGDAGEKLTGTDVYLDDEILGQTKEGVFKIRGSLGEHDLKIEKEGYPPYQTAIKIKEYAEEPLEIVLKKPIKDITVSQETIKAPVADKDKKDASIPEGNMFLTVRVFEDTISGRVPVKNAKILIDSFSCGETDENGLFKKKHVPGPYVLKVEKTEFEPEEKVIKITPHTESFLIVLRKRPVAVVKRDYNYMYVIIGSVAGSLGIIALVAILFAKKKGGSKETIFIDSIEGKIQKIHARFRPFNERKGMSLIYLGENPFNAWQKVVFKVLKEEHHHEDGLWLFDNEKKVHQILKNNGANNNQNHLAQYLYSGFLVRNKKQQRVTVFEYIEGVSLAEIIGSMKLMLQQTIEIGIRLCDPVMVIHCAGYCHLDLKPEHFIHKGQNRFILIDIATALKINEPVMTIFNSPPYSSPEQLKPRMEIDNRTDIYSLGVIFGELIKISMFGDLNSTLINSVLSSFLNIIGRMKNENRDARYQHILEVQSSLAFILTKFGNV